MIDVGERNEKLWVAILFEKLNPKPYSWTFESIKLLISFFVILFIIHTFSPLDPSCDDTEQRIHAPSVISEC